MAGTNRTLPNKSEAPLSSERTVVEEAELAIVRSRAIGDLLSDLIEEMEPGSTLPNSSDRREEEAPPALVDLSSSERTDESSSSERTVVEEAESAIDLLSDLIEDMEPGRIEAHPMRGGAARGGRSPRRGRREAFMAAPTLPNLSEAPKAVVDDSTSSERHDDFVHLKFRCRRAARTEARRKRSPRRREASRLPWTVQPAVDPLPAEGPMALLL